MIRRECYDLLEWYLALHGFTLSIVSELPTITRKADVTIYHPHGFLPQTPKFKNYRSKSIVLSKRSYQRTFKEAAPWNGFQRFQLGCSLCLFIGLSGDDPHIQWLYASVHDEVEGKRILGVIILVDNPENRQKQTEAKNRGLIHYYVSSHDELPNVLLRLCRKAAGLPV